MAKLIGWLEKYERFIPLVLFLIFAALALPGLRWGAPEVWNVDEVVYRVERAFTHGDYSYFDTTNFIYPSLPKYVMYGIGLAVYGLHYTTTEFVIASRMISVVLGGLLVILAYAMARKLGAGIPAGVFAALLVASNSAVIHNAHFAHNDIYLALFVVLTVYCLIQYFSSGTRLWLYAAFLGVGLAASSKYNGIILFPAPFLIYAVARGQNLWRSALESAETLFIGFALVCVGYVIGTPKALLWMAFYFKRMIPAFLYHRTFGYYPGAPTGLTGQWPVLQDSLGGAAYFLFIAAFLWFAVRVVRAMLHREFSGAGSLRLVFVILVAVVVYDLQFWVSYIYYERFFVPVIPILAVLAALFVQDLVALAKQRGFKHSAAAASIGGLAILAWSFMRVASVMLLFMNDPRLPASDFVRGLPRGASLEWTKYTPFRHDDALGHEERFIPCGEVAGCTDAEQVLLERKTDYLVVDSLTYARFDDPGTCKANPIECDFYRRLLADHTHYKLIASFPYYNLPWYLPQIQVLFVNTEVKVFALVK